MTSSTETTWAVTVPAKRQPLAALKWRYKMSSVMAAGISRFMTPVWVLHRSRSVPAAVSSFV
jgi:hypothetical protein